MYFYQEHIFLSKSKIKIKTCFLLVVINLLHIGCRREVTAVLNKRSK